MFRFSLYKRKFFCYQLIICIIALCTIGLVILNSAMANDVDRDSTIMKQILGIALGFGLFAFLTLVDYHFILRMAPLIYIICILLLVAVLTPLGYASHGAQRWINFPGFTLQPSEPAKIFLILFLSWFYWKNERKINKAHIVFGGAILFAVPALLIFKEPDLSTTLVVTFIFLAILYNAGISYRWIFGVLAVIIPIVIIGMFFIIRNQDYLYEHFYMARRLLSWMYPDKFHATGNNTQQENSVMAIASGQLFGKGINNTSFESVKNGNFLSEENCDFIFAVIGEELGFVGSLVVIGILLIMVFLCLRIAAKAKDMAGRLICVGMASLVAFQSFVNIGVATHLLPNTGLPLPFISAGLSSMVSIFMGMGVVMNVALQRVDENAMEW